MKPKLVPVLEMCISSGAGLGVARAFKHNDNPSYEDLQDKVAQAIWEQLHEWFDFEELQDE